MDITTLMMTVIGLPDGYTRSVFSKGYLYCTEESKQMWRERESTSEISMGPVCPTEIPR